VTTLSLRRLWSIYKRTAMAHCTGSRRDLAIAHAAFYSGARGVLKMLDHMAERGDLDEVGERAALHWDTLGQFEDDIA
jgi:hypothetical protein